MILRPWWELEHAVNLVESERNSEPALTHCFHEKAARRAQVAQDCFNLYCLPLKFRQIAVTWNTMCQEIPTSDGNRSIIKHKTSIIYKLSTKLCLFPPLHLVWAWTRNGFSHFSFHSADTAMNLLSLFWSFFAICDLMWYETCTQNRGASSKWRMFCSFVRCLCYLFVTGCYEIIQDHTRSSCKREDT